MSLEGILLCQPMREALLSMLDVKSLLRLRQCCLLFNDVVMKQCWNVNAHLRRFVDDPLRFRSMLGRYKAVLLGLNVVEFLAGEQYEASDLMICFDDNAMAWEFVDYLVQDEGCSSVEVEELAVKRRSYEVVSTLNIGGPNQRLIRLIACTVSLIDVVVQSGSTLDMNFMTWNQVCCLFPDLTVVKRKGLITAVVDEKKAGRRTQKNQWCSRGYGMLSCGKFVCSRCGESFSNTEEFGSFQSRIRAQRPWMMRLDVTGVEMPDSVETVELCIASKWSQVGFRVCLSCCCVSEFYFIFE
ncbi:hypothetical protein ACMFMG_012055 [Clarireedia jacksonii]